MTRGWKRSVAKGLELAALVLALAAEKSSVEARRVSMLGENRSNSRGDGADVEMCAGLALASGFGGGGVLGGAAFAFDFEFESASSFDSGSDGAGNPCTSGVDVDEI